MDTGCFGQLRIVVSLTVLKRDCYEEVSTPLQGMFRSSLQPMSDLTIHLFVSPAFFLAHCRVSSSDTICNSPNPLLADFVRFDSLRIAVSLMVLKHVY